MNPSDRPIPLFRSLTLVVMALVVVLGLGLGATAARAGDGPSGEVGIDEHLGQRLPQDLVFNDEDGHPVELAKLITRPTILTLVYFKCPNICGPLLNELAKTVDHVKHNTPGKDFNLVTVSFDPSETPDMAKTGRVNLLKRMKRKMPLDTWRFLTGEQPQIKRLADAVGFRYRRSKGDGNFDHAGTVIFVSKTGKIVRYLSGVELLPFDLEMAINDAREGTPRTVFQRIQNLCFGYDPDAKTYTLMVNRIVLFVTLLGAGIFALVLFLRRGRKPATTPTHDATDHDAGKPHGAVGGTA